MENQSIGDIYQTNDGIREKLKTVVSGISEERATVLPDGEKWTLAQLVEHIAIVENGMAKICAKLLTAAQADEKSSDGRAVMSEGFKQKAAAAAGMKIEAPERVRPTGTQTLADSLEKIEENKKMLDQLKPLFEKYDCTAHTFPHPAFGELTAHEWLALVGGHSARHIKQIHNYLEKTV